MIEPASDAIVFRPRDVDLARSPLRATIGRETYVLGAFNPGFARLPSGNLLLMVRIAEALKQPIDGTSALSIRWAGGSYRLDRYRLDNVDMTDPRKIQLLGYSGRAMALTSLSWLLPVEMSPDGEHILKIHYERAIQPRADYQQYGIEDPRISRIGDKWWMTVCSVSAERHATSLYVSENGLDYELLGIVLDHQNKDMVLFEGKVGDKFTALTRPLGDLYFAYPPESEFLPGPAILLAQSPDALHWKPVDRPFIRPRRGSPASRRIGGGAPPVLTREGWLALYHGVEEIGVVGIYRTFWALLERDDPSRILRLEDRIPAMQARPELSRDLDCDRYLTDVVFSTGILEDGENWLVASGEDDLCCRLTRLPKAAFA